MSVARTMLVFAAGIGLFGIAPWTIASCATVEDGDATPLPPTLLPETGASDGGLFDAQPDASCDASDPDCVTAPITCAEAAWCPVQTGVSGLYVLSAIWGAAPNDIWAAGSGGTIVHYDGTSWTPTPTPKPLKNTFRVIWGSGPSDVWIASATDIVFHATGFAAGGTNWTQAPNPTGDEFRTAPVYSGWGSAPGAPRFGSRAYYREDEEGNFGAGNQITGKLLGDGGVAWVTEPGTATVTGIWGSSADDLWLVGDNSSAFSWQLGWTAHGVRRGSDLVWTEVDSQSGVVLQAIWGSSAADVWAVGDTGTIRHIGTGGTRWDIVPSPTREVLHAIWGAGPNDVWAVGDSGAILHWDGASWKTSLAAFPVNRKRPHLYGIWGSGPDDVWIVGDGIALHHTGGAK